VVFLCVLAAAGVGTIVLLSLWREPAVPAWSDVVTLGVATLLGMLLVDDEAADPADVGMAAGFVVLGPFAAVLLGAVLSPVSDAFRGADRLAIAYRWARRVLPALVAAAVYARIVPSPERVALLPNLAAYIGVGIAWTAVSYAIRARYFASLSGVPLVRFLQAHARASLGPLAVCLPIGLAVAWLYRESPASLLLFLIPAALAPRLQPVREEVESPTGFDPTTGFDFADRLWRRLEEEVLRAQRYDQPFTLGVLLLENLDALHKSIGPAAVIAALQDVARITRRELRRSDYIARLDDGRLAMILVGATVDQAERVASRVRSEIVLQTPLRVSFGLASYEAAGVDPGELLGAAEAAAERARERGGDQVVTGTT
jgi:diguanylate cyclase (GGDEF)-like protein